MTEQKPFQVETTIDAPLETVWSALTTPEQIHQWVGWPHDGLDAEIRYRLCGPVLRPLGQG